MKRYALTVVLSLLSATAAFAQTKSPVEGVWKVAEVIPASSSTTEKPKPITDPQPGLLIFTKGYYSIVVVTGPNARAAVEAKDRENLTDAEKIAFYEQWRAFAANSGTYEIKGSTITRRASVAKNVGLMTRQESVSSEFKMEGTNTLWISPPVDRPNDPRIKWTRVE
jgi:Lipocalin-like domain